MMTQTLIKAENRTVLIGGGWETYQGLALDLCENPSKKLTYDQGRLEIIIRYQNMKLIRVFWED